MTLYQRAKQKIKEAKTIVRLEEIQDCIEYFYVSEKLTAKEYQKLDLIWCDQWIINDLGGH